MTLAAFVAPRPVTVEVAGRTVTVPAAPAAEWLLALASDGPVYAVIPGMLADDDQAAVTMALLTGQIDGDGLEAAFCTVVADVAGRPWWEAMRLVGHAGGDEVYGHLLLHGVDPARVTLAGFCSAVYALITQHMEEKSRNQFDFDLKLPPSGVVAEAEDWDTVVW